MTGADDSIVNSDSSEAGGARTEMQRSALPALVREIHATHFVVWTINDGGALSSVKIPVADIAQQISSASRALERNFEQAMQMIQASSRTFDAITQRWASQARQSEQALRATMSGAKLNQVKGLHNQIRTRVGPVQNLFRRAIRMLEEIEIQRQREAGKARKKEFEGEGEPGPASSGETS